ncbi:hypothetical protein C1H46_018988 [Malus baccata]|uniref:Uncharacterized protein n=1 Tax=Malus baccata TaxID=106549 RepID=A0A540M9G1_MALBA|nr:hypothetical protein C1H46_018988 [Malus baccata]
MVDFGPMPTKGCEGEGSHKGKAYWDVDETDQKQVKYLDDHFKNGYRVWKSDMK